MTQEIAGARSVVAEGVSYVVKVAFLPNGYSGPHAWYVVAFSNILFGEDVPLSGPFQTKREAVSSFWSEFSGADEDRLRLRVLEVRHALPFGA
jgi:hypothetical protein